MDFKKFFASYSGLRQENWFYRVVCLVLLGANLLLGVAVLSRREVVVLVPPSLDNRVKISLSRADRKYQESWALFFALLLGNITPQNLQFTLNEVEKYLAPSIYHDLINQIYEQAKGIKEADIATSFVPRELVYDGKTNHVLVKGQMEMRGAFGKPQDMGKIFEFGIAVHNYYPQITYLDAYSKKPKEKPKEKPNAKPQSQQPGH
jgi:conjugal transfer pilus assembly protein TraE